MGAHFFLVQKSRTNAAIPLLHHKFLGAFAKLPEKTISFIMSVRLSVRLYGTNLLQLD